ncbi:MAG: MTH1187 family thiamine-binding protein [Deltaproteobacteria bacterium]
MIIELSIIPIGVGTSLSDYVAEVMRVIKESGLRYESHSMGTNIECGWEDIIPLVKKCHDALKGKGVERISTSLRLSERTDKPYTMEGKMKSLDEKLGEG